MTEQTLDNTDHRIIRELQLNARVSFRALAEKIGLSSTPVLQRVKRLEADGVITGYRAVISPERVGLGIMAFVEVSLDRTTGNSLERFHRAVDQLEAIHDCHMVAGGFDYILRVRVKDVDALRAMLQELTSIQGIRQTQTYMVVEELKSANIITPA